MTTLQLTFRSRVGAADMGIVLRSVDELYRKTLWTANLERSRSDSHFDTFGPNAPSFEPSPNILVPGTRGRTWRVVQGLYVSRAASGSIPIDLMPLLEIPGADSVLVLIAGWLISIVDPDLLRKKRAEADKVVQEERGLRLDNDLKEEDLRERRLANDYMEILVHRQDRAQPQRALRDPRQIVAELYDQSAIATELLETFYDEPRVKGLPPKEGVRLLREALSPASRIERVQEAHEPLEGVAILNDDERTDVTGGHYRTWAEESCQ